MPPPQTLTLNHPTIGCPAAAHIVKKWYESGRWTGYELQFPGESKTRHLRMKEIRRLQSLEQEESNGRE